MRCVFIIAAACAAISVMAFGAQGQDITADFTDANFLAAVYEHIGKTAPSPIFDYDVNGSNTPLYAYNRNITNLAGIQHFTSLTDLNLQGNQLTNLDLSSNLALTGLNISGNQLTSLDLSANTALTGLLISDNQLTSLDLSANIALTNLEVGGNKLTSLDLSSNLALTGLSISGYQLTSLDLSANTALTSLSIYGYQLTNLDLSANTALTSLSIYSDQLTSLDLSDNTALTELYIGSIQLISLDLSANTALTVLNIGNTQLTSLDLSANTELTRLNVQNVPLTSLDLPVNVALTELNIGNTQLTSLDLSANTALTELNLPDNQLTNLDLSANAALIRLNVYHNPLTDLDVSTNTALRSLDASRNQLTSLDLSANTALTELYLRGNQLTSLDLSANTELTRLYLPVNQLTSLDLSANTELTWLHLEGNQLTSLDVSTNTKLTHLDVSLNYMIGESAVIGFTGSWGGSNFIFFPQKPKQDDLDIAEIKLKIESTNFGSVTWSVLNSHEMARKFIEDVIAEFELNSVAAVVTDVNFQAATNTTNGRYSFTVSLSKGVGIPQTTAVLELDIITDNTVAVQSLDRIIPSVQPDMDVAIAASMTVLTSEFTAGPNPVLRSSGNVNFFRQGKRIQNASLTIFDASGNVIKKISIKDEAMNTLERRKTGSWDLTDRKGRSVADGTYLVRGVVVASDGKKERVSIMIGVQ